MKKMSPIQSKLLEKLKILIKVLEDANIWYAAEGGTIIGSLRHEGFIPWDDDLDLMIKEEDIQKLIEVINRTPGLSMTNYKNKSLNSFLKVYFEDTFVMNGREKSYLKIDIFVLYKERKFSWYQNLMRVMTIGYLDFKSFNSTRWLSKFMPFTKKWLQKRVIKIIKSGEVIKHDTGRVYDDINAWKTNEKNTQYVYGKSSKGKFEDIRINIPKRAKETMFSKYGDIMIPPKKTDREVHGTKLLDK